MYQPWPSSALSAGYPLTFKPVLDYVPLEEYIETLLNGPETMSRSSPATPWLSTTDTKPLLYPFIFTTRLMLHLARTKAYSTSQRLCMHSTLSMLMLKPILSPNRTIRFSKICLHTGPTLRRSWDPNPGGLFVGNGSLPRWESKSCRWDSGGYRAWELLW